MSAMLTKLRTKLFPDRASTLASLAALAAIILWLPPALRWAVLDARFQPLGAEPCGGIEGACWPFVTAHLAQFVYGYYPADERWRVTIGILALLGLAALLLTERLPQRFWLFLAYASLGPAVAYLLFRGGVPGLPVVQEDRWGGLFVTLYIAITAMAASIPLGTLLALARRSGVPLLSAPAAILIEVFRGVPLIAVLFAAVVVLPLFLPGDLPVGPLARVMIANILYASAYVAEAIKGGLQTIPPGQSEAARSLGLSRFALLRLVVLPQTLRVALPAIVNTFVSLLKDTSLVMIVGIFDLLGIVQVAATDPKWLGYSAEGYVFAGAVYISLCLGLTRAGAWLETRLGRGSRMA